MKQIARELCPPILWRTARAIAKRNPALRRAVARLGKGKIIAPFIGDEFTSWMGYINPGMLSAENIALFSYCIDNLPSAAPVLEIGSFAGKSLNFLTYFLRRSGRPNKIFSVDEWLFEGSQAKGMIDGIISHEAY